MRTGRSCSSWPRSRRTRPYTPAPRDAPRLPRPRRAAPPNFDELPTDPPQWLAGHPPLDRHKLHGSTGLPPARAVGAGDRRDDRQLETTLAPTRPRRRHVLRVQLRQRLHTGEYRLIPGKLTAFDTDIHVPLVVVGPGVPSAAGRRAMSQNIDLAKTFTRSRAAPMPADDGHSLLPLLRGERPADWRNAALIEHHGPAIDPGDPDRQSRGQRQPDHIRGDADRPLSVRRVHRRRARVLRRCAPTPTSCATSRRGWRPAGSSSCTTIWRGSRAATRPTPAGRPPTSRRCRRRVDEPRVRRRDG